MFFYRTDTQFKLFYLNIKSVSEANFKNLVLSDQMEFKDVFSPV